MFANDILFIATYFPSFFDTPRIIDPDLFLSVI